MIHYGTWSPYVGSSSILLAGVLLLITGVLLYVAIRLHRRVEVKRPGKFLGVSLIVLWLLFVLAFLAAVSIYATALIRQVGHFTGPGNPITPVTIVSGVIGFFVIISLAQRRGPRIAVGSAIVGIIAAPLIFELPFDLIVMWRTYPPSPVIPFTLLFFVPLILIELTSFAMLTLSPVMKLSRYTLFCLAGMFLVFAVWALFGFAYPATPIPTALNMLAKVLAFASAVTLFLPQKTVQQSTI